MRFLKFIKHIYMKIRNVFVYRESRTAISSPDYAKQFNGKWHKVYDRALVNLPEPKVYGAIKLELRDRLDNEFTEAGVLEIMGSIIYRRNGWLFGRKGLFLSDHSWYGKHSDEIMKMPRFLYNGKKLSGACLTLASDFSVNSYGHFLIDVIPRLALFNKSGFSFEDVDYILTPKPPKGNASKLFDELNLPKDKLIWLDDIKILSPEVIIAPTFPGARRNYPEWVVEYLQKTFLPIKPLRRYRRIYVSRKGFSRNPQNEESVLNILINNDFEIYNPIDHIDSHKDFSEAICVIGASGSAMSGLAFCQPGTKVLELIPSDHVYPYYYTLSNSAKLEYSCLFCKSIEQRPENAWGPSKSNFWVDEDALKIAIADMACCAM